MTIEPRTAEFDLTTDPAEVIDAVGVPLPGGAEPPIHEPPGGPGRSASEDDGPRADGLYRLRTDPLERREKTRQMFAVVLVGTVPAAVVAIAALAALQELRGGSLEGVKDLAVVLVSPLIGVVGTVAGFYFGKHDAPERRA